MDPRGSIRDELDSHVPTNRFLLFSLTPSDDGSLRKIQGGSIRNLLPY